MKSPLVVLLLALAAPAAAQTLSGRVLDASTAAPLAARVQVTEIDEAVSATPQGEFTVRLPHAGRATLVVSHAGYYVQRLSLAATTAGPLEVALEPIVSLADRVEVTATRAREGVDPVSFTNVPQEKVAEAYWGQDPAMLLSQLVPGVYASNDNGNGIGYSYFSIRGFGQARTRVMLDGAPLNDASSGELFFIDLADFLATAGDVQVQRGVFGLSGLGGAIDLTTASPAVERALSVHTGFGSFGTQRQHVRWESGLFGGAWAVSARYSRLTTDGYRDQSWVDSWNYYVSVARYGERSRMRWLAYGGPEETHLAYNGVPREVLAGGLTGDRDRDRRHNPITFPGEVDKFFQPHYKFVHDVTFSPRTRFSHTAYLFQGDGHYDQFRANRRLFEYALPNAVRPDGTTATRSDLVRRRAVDEWDAGWVPSLTRQIGRWSVDLKGELRIHRARHFGEVRWAEFYPAGVPVNQRYYDYQLAKNTGTVAASARYAVTPRVSVSGGLQATRHTYDLSEDRLKGVELSRDYNFLQPRAGLVVALAPSSDAYVGVARGMREPFFRNLYDPQDYYAVPATLDPEDVWNVEAGLSLRRSAWRARGNVYWMTFRNEIVYAGALDDNGVPVYGNGAESRRVGVELDGSAEVGRGVGVDAALSLSRNTFTKFREYDWEGGATVYDGRHIAGYPEQMATVVLRGDVGRSRLSLTTRYVGEFFLDNANAADRVNRAYTVVDAAAKVPLPEAWSGGLGLRGVSLDVRVNNLTNARYTTFGYVDGGVALYIPAATRNVYGGLTVGW